MNLILIRIYFYYDYDSAPIFFNFSFHLAEILRFTANWSLARLQDQERRKSGDARWRILFGIRGWSQQVPD